LFPQDDKWKKTGRKGRLSQLSKGKEGINKREENTRKGRMGYARSYVPQVRDVTIYPTYKKFILEISQEGAGERTPVTTRASGEKRRISAELK
jgi:hypothetical protein